MDIGQVVAQRLLECDGDKCTVIVSIGLPVPVDNGANYFCPYEIAGLSQPFHGRAGGVDGVQSLMLALQMAATRLYTSEEWKAGRLRYLGSRNLDLPIVESIRDIVTAQFKDRG